MKREDIDTIVVANACLAFFESERIAIAESIVKLSVANSSCFDPLDKALITDKIQTEFASTLLLNALSSSLPAHLLQGVLSSGQWSIMTVGYGCGLTLLGNVASLSSRQCSPRLTCQRSVKRRSRHSQMLLQRPRSKIACSTLRPRSPRIGLMRKSGPC